MIPVNAGINVKRELSIVWQSVQLLVIRECLQLVNMYFQNNVPATKLVSLFLYILPSLVPLNDTNISSFIPTDKSSISRIDRLSKDRTQNTDYSASTQNNIRFSDSKSRPLKHRTHQYHHSSQLDDSIYYSKLRNNHVAQSQPTNAGDTNKTSASNDSTYSHVKSMNNSGSNAFARDEIAHDAYSGYATHSHYSKYRKKRPYSSKAFFLSSSFDVNGSFYLSLLTQQ